MDNMEPQEAAYILATHGPLHNKHYEALNMAIAALEAQAPRIMALYDIAKTESPVYLEIKGRYAHWMIKHYLNAELIFSGFGSYKPDLQKYNIAWRCWTQKPTPEQLANTPWEAE